MKLKLICLNLDNKNLIYFLLFFFSSVLCCDNVPGLNPVEKKDEKNENIELDKNKQKFEGVLLVSHKEHEDDVFQISTLKHNNDEIQLTELTNFDYSHFMIGSVLSFKPDNNNISFHYQNVKLDERYTMIMNSNGSNQKLLSSSDRLSYNLLNWHPSAEKYIATVRNMHSKIDKFAAIYEPMGIVVHNIKNGKDVPLCDFNNELCTSADYSPNGELLLIAKQNRSNNNNESLSIYLRNLEDNSEVLLIESDYDLLYPKWSPDGKMFAYTECKSIESASSTCSIFGDCNLYMASIENPKKSIFVSHALTYFGHVYLNYDFSPEGTQIAYSRADNNCNQNIYIQNFEPSNENIKLTGYYQLTDYTLPGNSDKGFFLHSWEDKPDLIDKGDLNIIEPDFECIESPEVCLPFLKIISGKNHTCGIREDNTLWCWGMNNAGQLGIGEMGDFTHKPYPVPVFGKYEWKELAAGEWHTCGIQKDNTLWCWGKNIFGQIGIEESGFLSDYSEPVKVNDDTWLKVTTGNSHTCAIDNEKRLWCWGDNSFKQLGNGTNINCIIPEPSFHGKWESIQAGDNYTCGLNDENKMFCWGYRKDRFYVTPRPVDPKEINVSNIGQISLGDHHICIIKDDQTLWCWGVVDFIYDSEGNNKLISRKQFDDFPPTRLGDAYWKVIDGGAHFNCGIRLDDTLWCWGGLNDFGQLGTYDRFDSKEPKQVGYDSDWLSVSTGRSHVCAQKQDKSLYCWGANFAGQLGDGTFEDKLEPFIIQTP